MKERLHSDGADDEVHISVSFCSLCQSTFQGLQMTYNIVGFGTTTQEIQDRLGCVMERLACNSDMSENLDVKNEIWLPGSS